MGFSGNRYFGQKAIQLVGEGLSVGLAEGIGAASLNAGTAQVFHEVAHGQSFLNVGGGVHLAAWIQGVGAACYDQRGERDVGGDDEIASRQLVDDVGIGDIEAARHLDGPDELRRRRTQHLVSNQDGLDLPTLGGAKDDFP